MQTKLIKEMLPVFKISLVVIAITIVASSLLLKDIYSSNLFLVLLAYLIMFVGVTSLVWLYVKRFITSWLFYLLKVVFWIFIEVFLSAAIYNAHTLQNNHLITNSKTNHKIHQKNQELTTILNKHNMMVDELSDSASILAVSCNTVSEQQMQVEQARLDALKLNHLQLNDNVKTITLIEPPKLGCSSKLVLPKIKEINHLKESFSTTSTEKSTLEADLHLQNKMSTIETLKPNKEFFKQYGIEILALLIVINALSWLCTKQMMARLRFENANNHPIFSRAVFVENLLKPNMDIDLLTHNDQTPLFKKIMSFQYLKSKFKESQSSFLKNKRIVRLNKVEHQNIINVLHTNTETLSGKTFLLTEKQCASLVKLKIVQQIHDDDIFYIINKSFFDNYFSYNPRIQ